MFIELRVIEFRINICIVTDWPRSALDPIGLRSSFGCWGFQHRAGQISHHHKDTAELPT